MYKNLETLLVTASNGKEFEEHLKLVTDFYGTDLTQSRLKAQLEILAIHFQQAEHNSNVSFKDIKSFLHKSFLQGLTISTCSLISEVISYSYAVSTSITSHECNERMLILGNEESEELSAINNGARMI